MKNRLIKINISNASKYHYLPFNRAFNPREDLIDSMNKHGFTVPILIIETSLFGKKDFFIVDGQNRLATALYLGIDAIGYVLPNKFESLGDLVMFVGSLNNSQKPWLIENYVKNYAWLNLPDYIELIKIQSEVPYTYNTLARMLTGIRTKGNTGIKEGKFKIHQKVNTENTLKLASKLSKYGSLSGRMIIALHYVSSLKGFDEVKFIKHYEMNYKCIKELKLDDYTDTFLSWIK